MRQLLEFPIEHPFRLEFFRVVTPDFGIFLNACEQTKYATTLRWHGIFAATDRGILFHVPRSNATNEAWSCGIEAERFAQDRVEVFELVQMLDLHFVFANDFVDFLLRFEVCLRIFKQIGEGKCE